MKYFSLVWSALFRSKTRTLLTLLSVTAAFLLFGLLDSVRVAFNSGGSVAGADRLVVASCGNQGAGTRAFAAGGAAQAGCRATNGCCKSLRRRA